MVTRLLSRGARSQRRQRSSNTTSFESCTSFGATSAKASLAAKGRLASVWAAGRRAPMPRKVSVSTFRAVYTCSYASSAATALGQPL